MKIYQVLKVTKEDQYLVKTCPMFKSAINWAKKPSQTQMSLRTNTNACEKEN